MGELWLFAAHGFVWLVGFGVIAVLDSDPPSQPQSQPPGHPPTPLGAKPCSAASDGVRFPWAHAILKLYGSGILALAIAASQYRDPLSDCPILSDIVNLYRSVRTRWKGRQKTPQSQMEHGVVPQATDVDAINDRAKSFRATYDELNRGHRA